MIFVNGRSFDCVEIHGMRYPVDKTLATNMVFFRVVDVCGNQAFYISPEEYYDTAHRRPTDSDTESVVKWNDKRQAFLLKHNAWYERVDEIKANVSLWLKGLCSKIEPKGYQIGQQPYIL
jgi:hypothetical protein